MLRGETRDVRHIHPREKEPGGHKAGASQWRGALTEAKFVPMGPDEHLDGAL